MEDQFLTYQKFSNKDDFNELTQLLTANGVAFSIEDTSPSFDPAFGNNELNKEYRIKLKKNDFEKVDILQVDILENQVSSVDQDYYLFEFTDEELIEVITKNDEWSKFDYLLAQKILKDRGKEINKDLLAALKRTRIEALSQPEHSQKAWIIAGYIFAFLGGFLGLIIGWNLNNHKKTLPNGDRVYGYSSEDRKHGKRIFTIAIIFLIIWMIARILITT